MAFWPRKSSPKGKAATAPLSVKASAAAAASGQAYWRSGAGNWSSWSYQGVAAKALATNPVVLRCVRLVCEGAASVPWALSDPNGALSDHPLLALIKCPNPMLSRAAFTEAVMSHLLLHGNAYIEKVMPEGAAAPVELYSLRPDRMRVKPGASGWPAQYVHTLDGRNTAFRVDSVTGTSDILHLKSNNPLDDHYGQSALQAASRALDLHSAADGWSKSLLDNAARPSGALVVRGENGWTGLSEDQFDRLRDQIAENFQGQANAGRPMILEGGLSWQPMGFSPADMDFQATKQAAARDIALAFGVPPMLLGIPGDNTYSNYQEANKALWRLTILPVLERFLGALNNWLVPHFGADLSLALDYEAISALTADRDARWKRIAEADFLSGEEKRRLLNLPAV